MYNSNYQKYNQLVNFGFISTGTGVVTGLLSNKPVLAKAATVTGAVGAGLLGYKAIKDDQSQNKEVFNQALTARTTKERTQLTNEYDSNNNAFWSDVNRNRGFLFGGLLGAGAVVAPTIGYNLVKGNNWTKYLT